MVAAETDYTELLQIIIDNQNREIELLSEQKAIKKLNLLSALQLLNLSTKNFLK